MDKNLIEVWYWSRHLEMPLPLRTWGQTNQHFHCKECLTGVSYWCKILYIWCIKTFAQVTFYKMHKYLAPLWWLWPRIILFLSNYNAKAALSSFCFIHIFQQERHHACSQGLTQSVHFSYMNTVQEYGACIGTCVRVRGTVVWCTCISRFLKLQLLQWIWELLNILFTLQYFFENVKIASLYYTVYTGPVRINICHGYTFHISSWNWHSELDDQALSKVFSCTRNLEKLDITHCSTIFQLKWSKTKHLCPAFKLWHCMIKTFFRSVSRL